MTEPNTARYSSATVGRTAGGQGGSWRSWTAANSSSDTAAAPRNGRLVASGSVSLAWRLRIMV